MKKLTYEIEGYTSVYNQETEEVEQKLTLSTVIAECNTQSEFDANYAIAEKSAVGEIVVEGEFDPVAEPTADEVLNAMLGVM